METGELIRAARIERGLTQKQLGDLCGMADSAIRHYESGRGNPTQKTLQRIAVALGISVIQLLPEPTEEERATVADIIREIGMPHGPAGKATVAETRKLLRRVAEIYGENAVILIRLTSCMDESGEIKVVEYAKSIFQEHIDRTVIPAEPPESAENAG